MGWKIEWKIRARQKQDRARQGKAGRALEYWSAGPVQDRWSTKPPDWHWTTGATANRDTGSR